MKNNNENLTHEYSSQITNSFIYVKYWWSKFIFFAQMNNEKYDDFFLPKASDWKPEGNVYTNEIKGNNNYNDKNNNII